MRAKDEPGGRSGASGSLSCFALLEPGSCGVIEAMKPPGEPIRSGPVGHRVSRRRSTLVWIAVLGSLLGGSAQASAEGTGTAEALRGEGEALLIEQRYGEACPKLAESYRLDAVTGTLLALATCHEAEGKLASASAEFTEVAARSVREGQPDRAKVARTRAEALAPRLSFVTFEVSRGAAQGLELRQDGKVVDAASFGRPVPVDPGEHLLEASAPGKSPWSKRYQVGQEGARETVSVPALQALPTSPVAVEMTAPEGDRSSRGLTETQIGGLVVAGVGVVGIVVGGVSGLRAMSKQRDSDPGCNTFNQCTSPAAVSDRRDAVRAAGFATVTMVTGGFLVLAGSTMYFLGGRTKRSSVGVTRAGPALLPGGGGVALGGRF
jgi:hypothetical protein